MADNEKYSFHKNPDITEELALVQAHKEQFSHF
jgi:hypothetical protein